MIDSLSNDETFISIEKEQNEIEKGTCLIRETD